MKATALIILFRVLRTPLGPAGAGLVSLVSALVLQHSFGWVPCPLCILQRLALIGLVLALLGQGVTSRFAGLWQLLVRLFALAGASASISHLWVLANPSKGSCGPGVARLANQLMDLVPGSEWLLEGAGACEDARYAIAGIPLPGLSLGLYCGLALWSFWLAKRSSKCN
jgi:protein dithiol:quinone oxidoreductase